MGQSERFPLEARAPLAAKQETIRRLLASARKEFARNGFDRARLDDIACSAGVTKQLIYYYYRDKEELFSCMLNDLGNEVMNKLLSEDYDSLCPPEALITFIDNIFSFFVSNPLLISLTTEGVRYHNTNIVDSGLARFAPQLTAIFDRIIARGIKVEAFRPDVSSDEVLSIVTLLTTGAFTNRYPIKVLLGIDLSTDHGMDRWRQIAVRQLLHVVEACGGRTTSS